jgi:hypothetical protein
LLAALRHPEENGHESKLHDHATRFKADGVQGKE